MTNNSLRVLCLEDNLLDAEILKEILIDAGYNLERDLTSTKKEFKNMLSNNQYDIILSDFKLPDFDAFGALRLCKEICPDIPFICVSGSIGEEIAIDLLKEGAVDYVLKDRLARLPIAVRRAIDEAKEKMALRIAQQELIESEQRFRALYENAKIGLYRTTPDGKILLSNKTLLKMLGYQSFETLAIRNLNEQGFAISDRRKKFLDIIEKDREINDFESEWICQDGTTIFVRESAQAIHDSNGNIIYYDGIVENITERKLAEEALNKSKVKLKELFENAPVGYHEIDELGNTSEVNKTELKMLGYSYEEMIGVPIWKFSRDSEESRERVIEKLGGLRPPNKNLEQVLVRKDGTLFTAIVDDVIFHNEYGVITGIRTTILDITERKQAEEAFKELSLRQQAILASVPDIIMEVDNNKIYTWANNAGKEFFGEDVIGKEAAFYFEGEQETYIRVKPLFNGNEDIIYVESWQRRKDGKKCLLAWWCKVLKDINGIITGALSSARDITEQQQAEEALHERDIQFRKFASQVPGMIYQFLRKADGTFSVPFTSESILDLFGCSPQQVKEDFSPIAKVILPEDLNHVIDSIRKSAENLTQWNCEYRVQVPGKPIRWMQGQSMPEKLDDGSIVWYGFNTDTTERKRMEEALAASEIKYRSFFENSMDAILLTIPDGRIISVNPAACNMFGHSESELIKLGRNGIVDITDPKLHLLLKERELNGKAQGELNLIRKDGTHFPADISSAVFMSQDDQIQSSMIIRDITERKLAEEALRINEERIRMILDATNIGIWDWDLSNGRHYSSLTTYFMLGYKQDDSHEFLEHWMERIHPDDREMVQEVTKKIFTKEVDNYDYNARFKHIDGSYHWLDIQGYVMEKDESGNPLRLAGIQMDITERKRAEKALEKSEERYRKAETIGHVGSWEYNIKSGLFWGSEESKRIYGFDVNSDEFSTEEVEKCILERERIHQALIDLIQFNKEYNLEFDIITKNNHERKTIFSVADLERDETDQPIKVTGIIQDITERKKTEKVIQNERLLLRTLIDNIPDAIYVKDLACRKTLANRAELRHMRAKSEAEVLGKNDFDWYPNELADKFYVDDLVVLQNSTPVINREEYIFDEKGQKVWLLSSKLPLIDKNNQVIGLLGIGRDITERKIAEDRQIVMSKILSILNRPNEWQQIINDILIELKTFTEIESLAIRLKAGEDFPYFVTNGFPQHFVESESSLSSKKHDDNNCDESYPEGMCGNVISQNTDTSLPFYSKGGSFWTNSTSEFISNNTKKEFEKSLRNTCNKEGYESVALIPLKSGEKVIGLLQFNDKRANIFTLDMIEFFEKIGSAIGIAFKRMQSEKQIKESEERYRFLVEATNDVIYRLKYSSMKYDYINPTIEKLTGYTSEEINEMGFKSIVVKISKYHVENFNIDTVVENREHGKTGEWQADYQIKTKDGRLIWLADHSYPWYDETGNVIGSIGILSDITERKNAEEEIIRSKEKAEEMNRLKSNFLANMSHELRTPLIGILGFADILQEDLQNDPRQEFAQIIFDSGNRLKETLNLILDLSKIESKAVDMILEDVEMTRYIPELVKVFEKSAEQKNIKVEITPSKELMFCNLDKSLLDSIINNLMNNAVKYTQQGKITVSINKINYKRQEKAEIQVADTGIGISEENLTIIFDPFRQGSEGLNRKFEGTGLGLTLVKKYVEQMNGSISVESKIGIGTTFLVRFPIVQSELTKNEKTNGVNKIMSNLTERESVGKPLVLYVEDDIVSQKVIETIAGNLYSIDFVPDGETAIELVKSKKFDIILMDINLRGSLNGIETSCEIKKLKEYENTPIIAVTAYAMVGDKEKILLEGCTHYISKPFSKNELLSLLNDVLNNY